MSVKTGLPKLCHRDRAYIIIAHNSHLEIAYLELANIIFSSGMCAFFPLCKKTFAADSLMLLCNSTLSGDEKEEGGSRRNTILQLLQLQCIPSNTKLKYSTHTYTLEHFHGFRNAPDFIIA